METVRGLRLLLAEGWEFGMEVPGVSPESIRYMDARGVPPGKAGAGPAGEDPSVALSLEELRHILGDCTRCGLHRERTHIVFGEGNPGADLVFVGEGPGRDEDRVGRPFVGEAGRLLTRIIQAMGLERKDVYICNVVKCRPPRNRDPEPDEARACGPFLEKQLEILKPRVICTLGRTAGTALLGDRFLTTRDRGRWSEYKGVRVMPTYHPAYLLRNEDAKRPVWEDVKKIMKVLGLKGDGND